MDCILRHRRSPEWLVSIRLPSMAIQTDWDRWPTARKSWLRCRDWIRRKGRSIDRKSSPERMLRNAFGRKEGSLWVKLWQSKRSHNNRQTDWGLSWFEEPETQCFRHHIPTLEQSIDPFLRMALVPGTQWRANVCLWKTCSHVCRRIGPKRCWHSSPSPASSRERLCPQSFVLFSFQQIQ